MKPVLLLTFAASVLLAQNSLAQILVSGGVYAQDFDGLANTGTANPWTDNTTLPGWYATRQNNGPAVTTYRAGTGSETTGALYSFGSAASTERALGSVGSGTPGRQAYGIRFVNDTGLVVTNVSVSYTGEQWRNGGNTSPHSLGFSYLVGAGPLENSDAANTLAWTAVGSLNFSSPTVGLPASALDGNNAANLSTISNSFGVTVAPGEELFLRWLDLDDAGSDHGLALDDLSVNFATTPVDPNPPSIVAHPQSMTVTQGTTAVLTVQAAGQVPFTYQWYFDDTPLDGATSQTLTLPFVNTNNQGNYYVAVTNALGGTNSDTAFLTVALPIPVQTNIAYLRTLQSQPNYLPTDTNTLFSARGVVTTYVNMTGVNDAQFYMQDENAGIAVFVSGGNSVRPANGDYVEVVGPLGHFNGLFELNLVAANPSHSVTIISNNAALPSPAVFDLSTATNIPVMEGLVEGSRVVISNVFIQGFGGIFLGGSNTNMTNLKNQSFLLRIDTRVLDMINQPIPEFVSSIVGVMGQFSSGPGFTNGYQFFPLQYADLAVAPVPTGSIPLSIGLSGTNASISWLSAAKGFTLQGNPDLNPANWQDVLETAVVVNNLNVITVPATNSQHFRLVRQAP